MDYLNLPVYRGHLALHCPSCDGNEWQILPKGDESEALHCPTCKTHAPILNWVSFIRRVGDDDKHVALVVMRGQKGAGYYVQVSTNGRVSENTESVRFCTMAGGGKSMAVLQEAGRIAASLKTGDHMECSFEGEDGTFKIYRGIGDADMWMKTSNIRANVFSGAMVFFPEGHVAVPHISDLMQAMFADLKSRLI